MGNKTSARGDICTCNLTLHPIRSGKKVLASQSVAVLPVVGRKKAASVCVTAAVSEPKTKTRGKGRLRSLSAGETLALAKVTAGEVGNEIGSRPKSRRSEPGAGGVSSPSGDYLEASSPSDDLLRTLESLSLTSNSIEDEDDAKEENEKTDLEEGAKEGVEVLKDIVYYGWFFSPEVSSKINFVVMRLFRECYSQVSQFQRFILTHCKEDDVKDPFDYYGYKRPGKRIKPDDELAYHITARFLGRSPDPFYQTLVEPFLDQNFRIHLVGIVFTPRSLGVRVKLSCAQKLIFDEKEGKPGSSAMLPLQSSELVTNQLQDELNSYVLKDKVHKRMNPNCKMKPDKNGIMYKSLGPPKNAPGNVIAAVPVTNSRAHITIACAQNVLPKRTGDDLVNIVDLEQRPVSRSSNFQQDFQVKHGILRQFGRHADAFVLYPSYEMIVPGRFSFFR